jgi:outer membrane protein TolC
MLCFAFATGCNVVHSTSANSETNPTHNESPAVPGEEIERVEVSVSHRIRAFQAFLGLQQILELDANPEFIYAEPFDGTMTLRDAATLTLESDVDVRIAEVQATGQEALAAASIRSLGPQLTLDSSLSRDIHANPQPSGSIMTDGGISLELAQPILRREARVESLLQINEFETSEVSLENERSLAILEVSNAYLSILQSRLIITFAEEHEARLENLRILMEEQVNAGGASPAELQRVLSRIQGIRATISDVRAGLSSNIAQLVLLTSRRPERLIIPETIEGARPISIEDAFLIARQNNLEIQASRMLLTSRNLEVNAVLARRAPTIDLSLTQDLDQTWGSGRTSSNSATIGLNMNWVLFRNGVLNDELRSAQARVNEAEIRLEDAEQRLLGTLRETYVVLQAISEQYEAYVAQVESNEAVVEAFTQQIVATRRPVLDVLEAYQALYQSKVDLTNVVITETQLSLRVLYLLGELTIDNLGNEAL